MSPDPVPASTPKTNLELSLIAPDLKPYLPLIEFIGAVMGEDTEVLLHDIRRLDSSIVGIVNGHVSGRTVGGSATDLVLSLVAAAEAPEQDFIVCYESQGLNGQTYRSHTFFIRDSQHEIIGLICVNSDVRKLLQAKEVLTEMLRCRPLTHSVVSEHLAPSSTETAQDLISRRIQEFALDASLMGARDKQRVVSLLDKDGLFLLKGSVPLVARALHISESTVYRYLRNSRT